MHGSGSGAGALEYPKHANTMPAAPSPTPRVPGTPSLRDSGCCGLSTSVLYPADNQAHHLFSCPLPFPYTFVPAGAVGLASWHCPEGTRGPLESHLSPRPWREDAATVLCLSPAEQKGSWCQFWGSHRPEQTQKTDGISSEQGPCHLHSLSDFPPHPRAGSEGREPLRGRPSRE